MNDDLFEPAAFSFFTSIPFLVFLGLISVYALIRAWPMIVDFFRSHTAPYRSRIPGLPIAALVTDLVSIGIVILVWWAFQKFIF